MIKDSWLNELQRLLEHFSGFGISADIAGMGLSELWGLYCFLRRMAEATP